MKKIYLSITLLCSAPCFNLSSNIKETGRIINAPIIASIDGKFPAALVMRYAEQVQALIEYNYAPQGQAIVKLHDLAAHEHAFPAEKKQMLLRKGFVSLINASQDFFSLFNTVKAIFDQIVEEWAEQFNMIDGKFYPFVKEWKELGTEYDILVSQIHSLQEFEQYLLELNQFLKDFLVSCPKAYMLSQK